MNAGAKLRRATDALAGELVRDGMPEFTQLVNVQIIENRIRACGVSPTLSEIKKLVYGIECYDTPPELVRKFKYLVEFLDSHKGIVRCSECLREGMTDAQGVALFECGCLR